MSYARLLAWTATTHPQIVVLCDHSAAPRLPRTHTPLRLSTCVAQLPDYMIPELLVAGASSLSLACAEPTEVLTAVRPVLAPLPTSVLLRPAPEVPADAPPLPRRAMLGRAASGGIDIDAPDEVRLGTALSVLGIDYDRPTSTTALHSDGCVSCNVCVMACPTGALSLRSAAVGVTELVHDRTACHSCIRCVRLCPPSALSAGSSLSLRTLATRPEVVLESLTTTACSRCGQLFPRSEGGDLCPTCAFRRATPFGSARPPWPPQ